LATLLKRIDDDSQNSEKLFLKLDLYDFQDQPKLLSQFQEHEWMAAVLGWALRHAPGLANSKIPAEELPTAALELWVKDGRQMKSQKKLLTEYRKSNFEQDKRIAELEALQIILLALLIVLGLSFFTVVILIVFY
jgi:hypothetical protein